MGYVEGAKKRKGEDAPRRPAKKVKKFFKKQKGYHSSSEEESDDEVQQGNDFAPVNMDDSEEETEAAQAVKPAPKAASAAKTAKAPKPEAQELDEVSGSEPEDLEDLEDDEPALDTDEEGDDQTDASGDSDSGAAAQRKKKKRNDPTAFATSMSKILSTQLTRAKRQDPVLSRSATASKASKEVIESRLEAKAKRQLHAEKRAAYEKGRVKDVLGLESVDVSTQEIQEQERRLKKTAQRGVVKLFNAVRAAQVQGDKAREEVRKEGIVGMAQREERVNEMSRQGFLDLIAGGGKKAVAATAQEA